MQSIQYINPIFILNLNMSHKIINLIFSINFWILNFTELIQLRKQLNVTFITNATLNFYSVKLSLTKTYLKDPPTAKMHYWDSGIIAEKLFTPNIPRFETVNVPPESSWI